MKTGLHQHQVLKQELRINPRLYQAMDLLYMPLLDLQQHLKQELLGNPFLELLEPEEEQEPVVAEPKPEKEKTGDDEPDWEKILLDNGSDSTSSGVRDLSESSEYVEPVSVQSRGVRELRHGRAHRVDRLAIRSRAEFRCSGCRR